MAITDDLSLKNATSAEAVFDLLIKEKILTTKDVIPMQYLLHATECVQLQNACIAYAQKQKARHFYEIQAGNISYWA